MHVCINLRGNVYDIPYEISVDDHIEVSSCSWGRLLGRGSDVSMAWDIKNEKELSALSAQFVELCGWRKNLYEL